MTRISSILGKISKPLLGAVLISLALGCTDEKITKPTAKEPTIQSATGEHAITVLITPKDDPKAARVVKFGPADQAMWKDRVDEELGDSELGTQSSLEPGFETQALVQKGEGEPFEANGWTLLSYAIQSCMPADGLPAFAPWVMPSPWRGLCDNGSTACGELRQFYMFNRRRPTVQAWPDQTCDDMLMLEEVLLCSADRMAQIADSVGTVTWDSAEPGEDDGPGQAITVTIPPQQTEDKFIARDLALNALAHIALLETKDRVYGEGPGSEGTRFSCAEVYAGPGHVVWSFGDALTTKLISYPNPFDPESLYTRFSGTWTLEEQRLAGERRLGRYATLLASSGRLVKDLVERSVRDDISGAQQQMAGAADSRRAARRAWGVDDGQTPYNSLRHALRVLFGRLEIGGQVEGLEGSQAETFSWKAHERPRDDPRCFNDPSFDVGIQLNDSRVKGALDLLLGMVGGTDARWNDVRPTTPGESLAMSVFDRSGIILPAAVAASAQDIREAIEDQLLKEAAIRSGRPFDQAFEESTQGQAISAVVAKLSDEEIRFGLDRVYDAFRLLADFDGVPAGPSSTWTETLMEAADAALIRFQHPSNTPEIAGVGGLVLDGGLNRDDLAIDVMARMGPLQIASQCGVFPFPLGAINSDHFTNLDFALGPKSGSVTAFQNVFHLGEAFRRRLATLAEETQFGPIPIHVFADAAAAEIRQWAASSLILREVESNPPAGSDAWYVLNLFPEDYGATSDEDFLSRLAIVGSSNPAHAECRAGIRKSCASAPPSRFPFSRAPIATRPTGLDKTPVRFFVDGGILGSASYLVLEANQGKPGQVLAMLNKPARMLGGLFDQQYFSEVISPLQRKLANEVFGIGQSESTERTCTNIAPVSLPREYCIEGMDRDQFVPLANELTSAGTGTEDSWRHYLALAEESAAKTDELGRQIIELGITRDLRFEAAAEDVGEECGVYPDDVDEVNASGGEVGCGGPDAALCACIKPETVDLVFLREDPLMNVCALTDDECSAADTEAHCFELGCLWDGSSCNACGDDAEIERSRRICQVFCPFSNTETGQDRFPFCSRKCPVANDAAGAALISHGGLNFITGSYNLEGDLSACTNLQQAFPPDEDGPELDTAKFATAAGASFSSQGGVATAISLLKLIEEPDRDWMLTLSGQPLIGTNRIVTRAMFGEMSEVEDVLSLGPEQQGRLADVYPACVQLNNCSDLGVVLKNAFPDPDQASDRFYSSLRAEVERAYFYLGAMAESIPDGNITMPVPIANRTTLGDDALVPAPVVYGPDRFALDGTTYEIHEANQDAAYTGAIDWSLGDSELVGRAQAFTDPEYFDDRLPVDNAAWLEAVYQGARDSADAGSDAYLYVMAENKAIRFNPTLVANIDPTVTNPEPVEIPPDAPDSRQFLPRWLTGRVAQTFKGLANPTDMGLVDVLDEATFYTPTRVCPNDSTFGAGLKRGRQVCTEADVSAVFYTTRHDEHCNFEALTTQAGGPPDRSSAHIFPEDGLVVFHTAVPPVNVIFRDPNHEVTLGGWFTMTQLLGQEAGPAPGPTFRCQTSPCPFPSEYFNPAKARYSWTSEDGTGCPDLRSWEVSGTGVDPFCANYPWHQRGDWGEVPARLPRHRIAHDRLKPTECSPGERVELFLAKDLTDSVHAMKTIVRALSLSCVAGARPAAVNGLPPPLNDEGDLRYLEAWVKLLGNVTTASASVIMLTEIPKPVVDHLSTGTLGTDFVSQGKRGAMMLELHEALRDTENAISNLGTTFALMNSAIENARRKIEVVQADNKVQQLALAIQSLENQRNMAIADAQATAARINSISGTAIDVISNPSTLAAIGLAPATGGGSLLPAAGAIVGQILSQGFNALGVSPDPAQINRQYGEQIEAAQQASAAAIGQLTEAEIQTIFGELSTDILTLFQSVQDNSTGITNRASDALQLVIDLKQNSNNAKISLAKAFGADFVELNGELVPQHINTVYRRQFDVLKLRYERALQSAKRSSYLARLAIEERLGTRMDDLTQSIGPLEAPSLWVDDLCTVQGIDYEKLRTADPATGTVVGASDAGLISGGSGEIDLIKGFADQYIGDYVAKLKEFVEFYNLQFPFREADDVGILSLREDLGNTESFCMRESPNLLFHSDHLEVAPRAPGAEPLFSAKGGWRSTPCDAEACVIAMPGSSLGDPGAGSEIVPVEPPAGFGSATWLHGLADAGGISNPGDPRPAGYIYQTVTLRAGTRYVLSWWEMARGPAGQPHTGAAPPPYRVVAFDPDWNFVAQDIITPSTSGWSERRALTVAPFADGDYHVAFSPAGEGQLLNASLAIANVQFEQATGNAPGSQEVTAYSATTASRSSFTGNCPTASPEAFRERFDYRCESGTCWHELKDLLLVDTELLNQGASSLVGKVAQGNFNYRVGGIALNVVGTGVLDCAKAGNSSCYASGYVEFDLRHHAHNVPLDDYLGVVRCFDFGTGNIRSGKALAAERFLSLPLGSADRTMVSEPPFLKPEFTGRPLSGSYRLRIKDSPTLTWENVEDIQLLVNYRYWSRVDKAFGQ